VKGYEFVPLGERALVISKRDADEEDAWREMAMIASGLESMRFDWIEELVPAYTTVTVIYDLSFAAGIAARDDEAPYHAAERLLRAAVDRIGTNRYELPLPRVVEIPVCYGGKHGPDLAEAAAHASMSVQQLIESHASAEYETAMIGFMPGFPYLSGMADRIAQPRKAVPALRVPAGSVAIGGAQTGVYPIVSPGGWQLIGRTPLKLFDPLRSSPSLLRAGDRIRFAAISEAEYERLAGGRSDELDALDEDKSSIAAIANRRDQAQVHTSTAAEGALLVHKPGLATTVQDAGRPGYRRDGVTTGGAMDSYALHVANMLVGNEAGAACLELTLAGPELEAREELLVAVCGADMGAHIDGEPLPLWRPVLLRRGARLRFGMARSGCRAYVAVAGGIGVPIVMGSRSTDARAAIGGIAGRRIAAGDAIPCGVAGGAAAPSPWAAAWTAALAQQCAAAERADRPALWAAAPWFAPPVAYAGGAGDDGIVLRAMPGSEYGQFSEAARTALYRERYIVAQGSDRMGCRLAGTPLVREARAELRSHGLMPGAVQVPHGAGPIVLAADCQTTGGYPKIAHVAAVDMPLLAQAKPGDAIRFQPVEVARAQRLLLQREREMRGLAAAIRCRKP